MISPLSHPFHWPGGIPPEINPDANGDINPEEVDEDAKGWLLFVEVRNSPLGFDKKERIKSHCSSLSMILGEMGAPRDGQRLLQRWRL